MRRGKLVIFAAAALMLSTFFMTAVALETALGVSRSLERQLGRLSDETKPTTPAVSAVGREDPWTHYCRAIHAAVEYVLNRDKRVVVVTQPYISDRHVEQQRNIVGMLQERFGDHPRLHYVNLGRTVDLRDPALAYDGMHFTALGNERIAESLVPLILEVLE